MLRRSVFGHFGEHLTINSVEDHMVAEAAARSQFIEAMKSRALAIRGELEADGQWHRVYCCQQTRQFRSQ